MPDQIAQIDDTIETGIPTGVVLAPCQRRCDGAPRDRVGIAVGVPAIGLIALIQRAWQVTSWWHKVHPIGTRHQIGKGVKATGVGGRRVNDITTAIQQVNRYPRQAWFTAILHPIAVRVKPDPITNGCEGQVDAHVPAWIIFSRAERGQSRCPSGRISITIGPVVTGVWRCHQGICREGCQHEVNAIGCRRQISKAVIATGISGRGADHRACAVQQFYSHIRYAAFAVLL